MSVVPSQPSMHPSAELAVSMMKLFQPMFTCGQTGTEMVFAVETCKTRVQIYGHVQWFQRTLQHLQWDGVQTKVNGRT